MYNFVINPYDAILDWLYVVCVLASINHELPEA